MRAPAYSTRPDELLLPATRQDPHPLYRRLREQTPIARVGESGVHTVASWAAIDEVLGREEDFSANLTGVLFRNPSGAPDVFPLDAGGGDVIATADEPAHSIHRRAVQPRLEPRRIPAMEARVRGWAREALDAWQAGGGGDIVPVAERVPALALAALLGLPEEDVDAFRTWSMMGGDILAGDLDGGRLGALATESGRMAAYLAKHLDRVADAPDPDPDAPLLHALARAQAEGRLDRREAVGIAIVLFGAGGESTAALIGSCLHRLAGDPALAERIRREPALVPRFVEEVVRLEPPFNFHYRVVRRPCSLGGFALEAGDRLMLLWASANRDAALFADPDQLRLDRRFPRRHMGFGRGSHFCVGATLARLEARVVVEELLATTRHVALRATGEDKGEDKGIEWAPSIFVRRLARLELEATT